MKFIQCDIPYVIHNQFGTIKHYAKLIQSYNMLYAIQFYNRIINALKLKPVFWKRGNEQLKEVFWKVELLISFDTFVVESKEVIFVRGGRRPRGTKKHKTTKKTQTKTTHKNKIKQKTQQQKRRSKQDNKHEKEQCKKQTNKYCQLIIN